MQPAWFSWQSVLRDFPQGIQLKIIGDVVPDFAQATMDIQAAQAPHFGWITFPYTFTPRFILCLYVYGSNPTHCSSNCSSFNLKWDRACCSDMVQSYNSHHGLRVAPTIWMSPTPACFDRETLLWNHNHNPRDENLCRKLPQQGHHDHMSPNPTTCAKC